MTPLDLSTRDRVADLNILADHVLRGLFTWAMPADLGVDYGFERGGWGTGPRRTDHRSTTSVEEILGLLGIGPEDVSYPCRKCGAFVPEVETYAAEPSGRGHAGCWGTVGDADSDWPPKPTADDVRGLGRDGGTVLRARGGPKPEPPKPPRPLWADLRSKDGRLVLTVPDELIPYVGTDTAELAADEISGLGGMLGAYDRGPGDRNYLSAGFVRASFALRMALWRERKKVHALTGGRRDP